MTSLRFSSSRARRLDDARAFPDAPASRGASAGSPPVQFERTAARHARHAPRPNPADAGSAFSRYFTLVRRRTPVCPSMVRVTGAAGSAVPPGVTDCAGAGAGPRSHPHRRPPRPQNPAQATRRDPRSQRDPWRTRSPSPVRSARIADRFGLARAPRRGIALDSDVEPSRAGGSCPSALPARPSPAARPACTPTLALRPVLSREPRPRVTGDRHPELPAGPAGRRGGRSRSTDWAG